MRLAISLVTNVPVCRNHKLRNVLGRVPREQQAQTGSLMRAAWKLNQKDGMAKFRQIAGWLEHDYPDAAAANSRVHGIKHCQTGFSPNPQLALRLPVFR